MNVAVIGYGSRGEIYANGFFGQANIVAVCDPRKERLEYAQKNYGVHKEGLYTDENAFFAAGKLADLCIVSTTDKLHYRHAIAALNAGYDLLLEKPIACSMAECEEIRAVAERLNRKIFVCHVLRYADFFSAIKRELDTGEYGEISTINTTENVAHWHYAHSYVRGNWHKAEDCTPMIVAKCCHDLDVDVWYIGKPCIGVSSMGNLRFFTEKNAPAGSTDRCVTCPHKEDCAYSAEWFYIGQIKKGNTEWPTNVLATEPTEEKVRRAIEVGPYGKCVFRCDNNVVDHQVVNMEFEGGATAHLTMTAFSDKQYREIAIHCEKGEIYGSTLDNLLHCYVFGKSNKVVNVLNEYNTSYGHGGGDHWLVQDILNWYEGRTSFGLTSIENSIMSHKIGFAAEESRLQGGVLIKL